MAKARSFGGNFLINMGPDSHGELPASGLRRMQQLADWMRHHEESIFNIAPGPWPERGNVPVTVRDDTWFLHVHYLVDYPIILKDVPLPAVARWKRTGKNVSFMREGNNLVLDVPSGYPTAAVK